MLKNYLIITLRIILANKVYSFISIGGLAIGMVACLLVALFTFDEFRYDRWLSEGERIYKVEMTYLPKGIAPFSVSVTSLPVLGALKDNIVGIESGVQILERNHTIKKGNLVFSEQVSYTTDSFFDIFDLPLKTGERTLSNRSGILISSSMSRKYFGSDSAIGKVLTINSFDGLQDFEVLGVLEDTPINTHFKVDFLVPIDLQSDTFKHFAESWYAGLAHTYVKFQQEVDVDVDSINQKIATLSHKYLPAGEIEQEDIVLNILPMFDIHLYGDKEIQRAENGSATTVWTFVLSAVLILLIASINFVNLSIARAAMRGKEVGLRKVMGAGREQLAFQFITESWVFAFFALLVSIICSFLFLPWFNELIQKDLSISVLLEPAVLLTLILLTCLVGTFAGIYPAFVLSSFMPSKVLRANKSSNTGSALFRNLLVVLQFAASAGFIVSTSISYQQTKYLNELDKGFDIANRVNLIIDETEGRDFQTVMNEFLKIEGVEKVGMSDRAFPSSGSSSEAVTLLGHETSGRLIAESMTVNESFFATYNIQARSGRVFSKEFVGAGKTKGGREIVVNTRFLQKFGIRDAAEAIGMTVSAEDYDFVIVGVVDDMYIRSVKFEVRPMIYHYDDKELNVITLKLTGVNVRNTLRDIDSEWKALFPASPIQRSFVSADFEALYTQESQQIDALLVFSIIAILLASLGLYGLASFSMERRFKEVGIRKVLGASATDIVLLLLWQFTKPVLVGCSLGLLASFWFMQSWLESFVNRIDFGQQFVILVATLIISMLVAWLTIIFQVNRVASSKPVYALRYE